MSEKQKQPETCIINDTSQRTVAMWFRCGEKFNHLLQIYCWVRFERILEIAQHNGEFRDGEVDCLKCPVCRGTVPLKDEQFAWDLMYGGQELLSQHHVTINTLQ